jgi:hemolysin activation/secretion protein
MRRRLAAAFLGLCGVLPAASTPAQVPRAAPPVEQLRRPSEVPLPVPEPEQPPARLKLPQEPPLPSAPTLSQGVRFEARGFRFYGNTLVSDAELQAIAEPFVGRSIGNAELDELRVRVTRRYVDAGYINSGAVIPDQDVSEGIVAMRIVEGRLGDIALGGTHRFDPDFLRARIRRGAPGVLNVNRLQEHMQVLLQDPLIERISAELGPGAELGEAVLRADVVSAPLFLAGVMFNNERSPVVGADQVEGFVAVRNLLGRGDIFSIRPGYSEGLRDVAFAISLPLSAGGTTLHLRGQRTRSRIVESPLDQLDISARSRSLEIGLSQPIVTRPRQTLNATGWLVRRDTRNFFLDEPSPFIPGAPDGHLKTSVARLGLDGVDRTQDRVLAARLQVSYGLDAFGATISGAGTPDSRFTAWLAQAQWVQRIAALGGHTIVRAELQRANGTLPSSERYSLGGVDNVRGYREDLLVRDSGWLMSFEYRHPVGYLPWSGSAAPGEGSIHLALFADVGRAWNRHDPAGGTRIYSVGPGVRYEPVAGMELQLYYGKALKDVPTPTRTAQDRGVHFRLGYTRAF